MAPAPDLSESEITRLLSSPRCTKYLAAAGSFEDAIMLYEWNVRISSAFFESMHYFEISLRNIMHDALSIHSDQLDSSGTPWYRHPGIALEPRTRKVVDAAVWRATRGGVSEREGKVVAELGLGFWSKLLSDTYNRTLWEPCLGKAFPNARRRRLHRSVEDIARLRNRIAHHEPIHQRPLLLDFSALLGASKVIAPGLETWIEETSRVRVLLMDRPQKSVS